MIFWLLWQAIFQYLVHASLFGLVCTSVVQQMSVDVHHNRSFDMAAVNVLRVTKRRNLAHCTVEQILANATGAIYSSADQKCVVIDPLTYAEFQTVDRSHLLLRQEHWSRMDAETCTIGQKGQNMGVTSWSDKAMWRMYGRITAVKQWQTNNLLCGIQFRFGWTHWGDLHGRAAGTPYEVVLDVGEYLVTAPFFTRVIVDRIFLVSSTGITYKMLDGDIDFAPNLGGELAYLAGYTHSQHIGLRISDLAVYQTQCYTE